MEQPVVNLCYVTFFLFFTSQRPKVLWEKKKYAQIPYLNSIYWQAKVFLDTI